MYQANFLTFTGPSEACKWGLLHAEGSFTAFVVGRHINIRVDRTVAFLRFIWGY